MKKLSFVIPSFNSVAWLSHAIESCQKQDYANTEIIVVDDGSTDTTPILMKFLCDKDKRISYIRLPKNVGRSKARNIGNDTAKGDYICVLDADDVSYPNRAKLTVNKLEKADFVHGSFDFMDVIGSKLDTHYAEVFSLDRAMKERLNFMVHSSVAYTKEIARQFQYPEGELADLGLDDWSQQLAIASSGAKIDFILPVIGAYRDHGEGVSKKRDSAKVIAAKEKFLESMKVPA